MNDTGYWSRPPLLMSVPRVWPWASSRDQCHVSPQLWRIKRETWSGWEERGRDSTWHVSYVQSLDALTIGTWLTRVCAWVIWDMYVYSWSWAWMGDVLWGVIEGVMTNLASRWFWSRWLARDGGMVPLCLWDQLL